MDGASFRVRGQVQGVGFRPFVWALARRMGVTGTVWNDPEGVMVEAFGPDLPAFAAALAAEAPPLARVEAVEIAPLAGPPAAAFTIAPSRGRGAETRPPPDAATCAACAAEIRDPANRRFGHPFANCTDCGPRFSILAGLPYDRAMTAMAAFPMCAACAAEYASPADRRFHAQPVACPACGPRLWFEAGGAPVPGDPVALAAAALRSGAILAVKGIGGFHLACRVADAGAVARLRARKRRPAKPFALMGTLAMIRAACAVSAEEAALLADPAAPVVLLDRRGDTLPEAVAPGMATLGWMLPYTPLHHLLLDALGEALVMTSGNLSGEPQAIHDAEARDKLSAFADGFLMHDRPILRRLDDGVERAGPAGPMVLRRGRGRVPGALPLPAGFAEAPPVLAAGGQLKGAVCLTRGGAAILSHHLGDLDDALCWEEFRRAVADYADLFGHRPAALACDLHPGYRPTLWALEEAAARGLLLVAVQHHHAHLAACLADAGWPRRGGAVAGIVLDGTGLGTDGTVWGGEVLLGDYAGFIRAAHLAPAPLPGGEAAAREPWRNAVMRLDAAGLGALADRLFAQAPRRALRAAAAAGMNAPPASSAGRLFDAAAAMLGLCPDRQSYEGEAAMRLEALAAGEPLGEAYPWDGLDPAPMFAAIAADLPRLPPGRIAARVHGGVARAFAGAARALVEEGRAAAVALSGGCFQNARLVAETRAALAGIAVLGHRRVPANDGGLALGQALVAAATAETR